MWTDTRPTRSWAFAALLVAASVLGACQAEDDVGADLGPDDPGGDATASPTVTVTETVTETATPPPAATPDDAGEQALRDLLVAPQEPLVTEPGTEAEFTLAGRLGQTDAEVPRLVGFGWTPCEVVDATEPGALTFPDVDGDGHADQMGESDTGSASLLTVNGERFENVDDEWPTALHTRAQQPPLVLTMLAEEGDCATVVLFYDEDGDEELDVGPDGTPTEVYGVSQAVWER